MTIQWSQQRVDELALWFVVQHSVVAYNTLVAHFGSANLALKASSTAWQTLRLHHSHAKKIQEWQQNPLIVTQFEQAMRSLDQMPDSSKNHIVGLNDMHYPKQLKQIADPPPFLFVYGNIHSLSQPQIAMVGSRKPSQTGQQIAIQFACYLAQQGFYITSGMAHGIDTSVHQGALQAGNGQTIAVMGTGINVCYPTANQALYQQIVASGGALVSEFMPNTPAREFHFPRRNRIVSGLSLGVLVVEAALKSGSLITAQTALEQNRQVFAIPGHLYNEQSRGCHQLIRDGAMLVDDPQQVVDELDLPRRWQCQAENIPVFEAPQLITESSNNSQQTDHIQTSKPKSEAQPKSKLEPTSEKINYPKPDLVRNPTLNFAADSNGINNSPSPALNVVPEHLQPIYHALDWTGISLDTLVETAGIDVATLTSHLMEMELMGFAVQQGGLYQRCRQ